MEVTDDLRSAILRGQFAPNQRLIESDLTTQLDASRFAVRGALSQLAAEGLVELTPNRGARVREVTLAEALEITDIRQVVEGLVAARAAERISDVEREELLEIGEQMSSRVRGGEMLAYSDLNAALHAKLRAIAQHAAASRIIGQLNGQLVRHQFALSLFPGRPSTSLPEHLAIIRAVTQRDPQAAESAMRAHLTSVRTALIAASEATEGGRVRLGSAMDSRWTP